MHALLKFSAGVMKMPPGWRVWPAGLVAANLIDVADVVRYVRGDREETVAGL